MAQWRRTAAAAAAAAAACVVALAAVAGAAGPQGANVWEPLQPAANLTGPGTRAMHSAVAYSGKEMVIFGGQNLFNVFNDTWLLDSVDAEWHQLAATPAPGFEVRRRKKKRKKGT